MTDVFTKQRRGSSGTPPSDELSSQSDTRREAPIPAESLSLALKSQLLNPESLPPESKRAISNRSRHMMPTFDDDEFECDRPTLHEIIDQPSIPPTRVDVRDRVLLTLLTGPERGSVYKVEGENITIGRSGDATITIPDLGLSRIHARLVRQGSVFYLADQSSTNGTFVDELKLTGPTKIGPGTRFRLGLRTVVVLSLHDELEESAALSVHDAALHDRLTGVYNRGVFDDRLKAELAFALRHKTPLSLLLFDIDHFKRFNDVHGHLIGDAVLVACGESLQNTVRTEDIVARYGGEEFVVIARSTAVDRATVLGERIRVAVEKTKVMSENQALTVTVSIGVATLVEQGDYPTAGSLVAAADRAMYAAKEAGRNRVIHANDLPPLTEAPPPERLGFMENMTTLACPEPDD